MELPKSWNLKTKKRSDGRLDIVGRDDAGRSYRVRTTDTPEVSQRDLDELKAADRESYPNRETAVKSQMERITGGKEKKDLPTMNDMMNFDESDWIAAAEPIVHAGFGRKGCTLGSTWAYRRNFDQAFRKDN